MTASNSKSYLSQFSFYGKEETLDYDALKKIVDKEVTLPSFIRLEDPVPVYNINIEVTQVGSIITVQDEEGTPFGGTFAELADAYDFVRDDLKGNVIFTGALESITGTTDNLFVMVPTEDGYSRLLFETGKTPSGYLLKNDYVESLHAADAYEANPNDFVTSFDFVNMHPAFWHRKQVEVPLWNTSSGISLIWVSAIRDESGKVVVIMETGSLIDPDRVERYHDTRLDTYASTYEEGIVALAAAVHKIFNVDGSERDFQSAPGEHDELSIKMNTNS